MRWREITERSVKAESPSLNFHTETYLLTHQNSTATVHAAQEHNELTSLSEYTGSISQLGHKFTWTTFVYFLEYLGLPFLGIHWHNNSYRGSGYSIMSVMNWFARWVLTPKIHFIFTWQRFETFDPTKGSSSEIFHNEKHFASWR